MGTDYRPPPGTTSGAAGGDLSGTYPNPAVAKINGTALGVLTGASVGDQLVWNGTAWVPSSTAGPYLPLAGGTMSGAINMGSQDITQARSIGVGTAASGTAGDLKATTGEFSGAIQSVTSSGFGVRVVGSTSAGDAILQFTDNGISVQWASVYADSNKYLYLNPAGGVCIVTGSLRVQTLGAFATGDKYVIVDSSGNLHVSSLGPVS